MTENSSGSRWVRAFFSPAVALMGRLDISRKFMLLGLMSLAAMAVVAHSLYASLDEDIRFSQRELEGLKLIEPIPRVMQILQRHRGLSAGALGGDAAMRDRLVREEKDVVAALAALEAGLPPGLASGEALRQIGAEWRHLREAGLTWTATENFAVHTRLIGRVQSFEVAIADAYALTLDPEISTYYLIDTIVNELPHAIEHLGQLRAYGTGILAGKQASPQQQTEINILISKLADAVADLEISLDKAGRHNPALHGLISVAFSDIAASAQQVSALVTSDILAGRIAAHPADFFALSTVAIERNYTQLHEALLPATEALIKARIARAENTLYASAGIAALLFLLVAYFSIGIARAVVVNIRSLAGSAHAFANGNLNERVELGARDELGRVGESFNEMAFGFRTLLEASRENEARLQELSAHLEERVAERTVELERAQRETEVLLQRNQVLMLTSLDGIHVMDARGNILAANDAFCRMLGYTEEEVSALNVADWDAQWTKEELRAKFRELIGKSAMFETLWRRKDGTLIHAELSVSCVELEGQNFMYASGRDITERKRAEQEIHNLAFYDALTRLPNRRLFLDRFGSALTVSVRHNSFGAVLFIDLDRFKLLNDTLGHDYGDLLLIEVAVRIKSCVREMDTVARLGGDEFVVLIEGVSDAQEEASLKVGLVAEKIREALARPYHLNGHEHLSSPSIGVSLYRGNEETVEELLRHADMAMYQAKESGRNAVRFFDPVMQNNVATRAALVNDLRNAIAHRQLHLHYQLQVDNDNRPVGAEALLRWVHPQRGMVMPDDFLPDAEESALVLEIGDWVLETACRQLVSWGGNQKMRDLALTVNVSAKQFAMPDFADKVAGALQTHQINPARLKLELTESMALDDLPGAAEKMHALKALGVSLSLDNFGTRYSSLSSLKQLPLDQIKLGRSFVQDVASDGNVALLVQSIIDMSGKYHITVIAEGVENNAQLISLKERDCVAYQGFLFSKAVPVEEFEKLLDS